MNSSTPFNPPIANVNLVSSKKEKPLFIIGGVMTFLAAARSWKSTTLRDAMLALNTLVISSRTWELAGGKFDEFRTFVDNALPFVKGTSWRGAGVRMNMFPM